VTGTATGVTAAAGLLVVGPVLGLTVLVAATPPASAAQTSGALKAGAIPAAYLEAVTKAGGMCPAVSGPLIAAQIETESGWNPTAVSPKGAEGLSQFLPGTWASRGIDGNGDGSADPFDPLDAIASQAGYDCALAGAVAAVPGDRVGNMLAAYNAGPGAVLAAGGVPPYTETQRYVRAIQALIATYSAAPLALPAGTAGAVITAAQTMLGVPYVWGGTTPGGGFDCSGLTSWAYAQAGVRIPRTAAEQEAAASPTADPRPGDLVFFGPVGNADHVGLYLGGGRMLDAAHTGTLIRIEALWPGSGARFGRVLA